MHLKFVRKADEEIILKHSETWIFQSLKRVVKLRSSAVLSGEQEGSGRAAGAPATAAGT